MTRLFSITAFLFLSSFALFAQIVPGRYIVELSEAPAAQGLRANARESVLAARVERVRATQLAVRARLEQLGARVLHSSSIATNTITVVIPDASAPLLAKIPGVVRVHAVRLYKPLLDHALPLEKVPQAWDHIGGAGHAGAGIKIAIIDTGIDVNHPAFQDSSLKAPDGFPKTNQDSDRAYTNGKVIAARAYDPGSGTTITAADDVGHGTGVAMTAAGATNTGPFGPITGVAPKAFLGNYKVFPDPSGGAPTDLIIQAIDDAVSDGMDVINLSLGSLPASRPGDDILVTAVENASSAGVLVAIAAGNDGPDANTISSPGIAPSAITVGSSSNDRILAASVRIDGQAPLVALPGSGPNSSTPITGPLVDVAQFDPSGLACGSLPAGSLNGAIALILRGSCFFEQKIDNVQQAGAVAALVYTDAARPGAINMSVGQATLPAEMVSYPDGSALKRQIASSSVAATLVFTLTAIAIDPNRLSAFSSRGPNTDSGIKPDLVAVGSDIYTATPGNAYVVESGTSFSSPMVAGAAALVKAAHPGLTAQQYRSLVINNATPILNASGAPLGLLQQGAGLLNALNAVSGTVTANPTSLSFGIGASTLDATLKLTLTNAGTATDTFAITAAPYGPGPAPSLSASSVQLDPGQSQQISVELAGAALDPGAYQGTIQIQGTLSAAPSLVPYFYGIPSQTAQTITILDAPTSGSPGTRHTIFFRMTDAAGLAVSTQPDISITSGGGRVILIATVDDQVPGAFAVVVRLGPLAGDNVVHIELNGVSKDVVITGN